MRVNIRVVDILAKGKPAGFREDYLAACTVLEDGSLKIDPQKHFELTMPSYHLQQAPPSVAPPPLMDQATSLVRSAAAWGKSGFAMADSDKLTARLDACKTCPEWDAAGMAGTGRCRKCGCSTQAKLRIDSEKCPLGKW